MRLPIIDFHSNPGPSLHRCPFRNYCRFSGQYMLHDLTPIPPEFWGCSRWTRSQMLGAGPSQYRRLVSREIIFSVSTWACVTVLPKKLSTWSGANVPADTQARRRLRSASSTSLDVRRTRLSTVGDRAFPVAAARLWNSLPSHVTAAPSFSIFCCRLKSHLFSLSYPAFWLFSHLYSARAVTRHFGHYNRYYI